MSYHIDYKNTTHKKDFQLTFLHEFPWKKYALGKADFEICGLPEGFKLVDPNFLSDESLYTLVEHLIKDKVKVHQKLPQSRTSQQEEDSGDVEAAGEQTPAQDHQENSSSQVITPTRVSPNKWRFVINSIE